VLVLQEVKAQSCLLTTPPVRGCHRGCRCLYVLLLGAHDGITINYGDEVIPLSPTTLFLYVLLIRCVHYVLAKCKE
jgi:hypothetical protein